MRTRLVSVLDRTPGPKEYCLALAVTALAVLFRALLEPVAPGVAYLVLLFPAVVVSGVFWGTLPALAASALGAIAIEAIFLRHSVSVWPPFDTAQVDILVFIPACAAVLWATRTLRQAAAGLLQAEARLAEVFRQFPGAAAILEAPDGKLLLRSTQSDTVLDRGERTVLKSDELEAYGGIHNDGRPFVSDDYPIVRALKTGEVVHGEHLRFRRGDGKITDLEVHAGPIRAPDGRILAAVGMAFDVSERVRAEQLLRQREADYRTAAERLRAAVDAAALGLWEVDLREQTVQIDARFAVMLGLAARSAVLTRAEILRFIDPAYSDKIIAAFQSAIAGSGPHTDEVRMVTAQNEKRWFVARGTFLAETGKVIGVIRDVTERRDRETALRAAIEERELLMREADHRIKNSLQLVSSLLGLQLHRVDDEDTRSVLEAAINRVTAISDAHLALQNSPDLKSVEIDDILRALCRSVGQLNPDVAVQCTTTLGLWLDAEIAIPIGLIASELLTNALRHAFPAGEPGSVGLNTVAEADAIVLTIADAGVGLPTTARRAGLGTTVTKALAKQIGATMQTESLPGCGVTVTLRVPLQVASRRTADMRKVAAAD